jgi:bZIP-type transcription factor MBZ1
VEPPEVFAKMTSKEKRQLRNKISARNFRVRRKGEYIYVSF